MYTTINFTDIAQATAVMPAADVGEQSLYVATA
jgi:hypothetical protein